MRDEKGHLEKILSQVETKQKNLDDYMNRLKTASFSFSDSDQKLSQALLALQINSMISMKPAKTPKNGRVKFGSSVSPFENLQMSRILSESNENSSYEGQGYTIAGKHRRQRSKPQNQLEIIP